MKKTMLDLDGVIADWQSYFLSYIEHKTHRSYPLQDFGKWKQLGLNILQVHKYHEEFLKEGYYKTIPLIVGAKEGLRALDSERHIVLAISRDPRTFRDTELWIQKHDLDIFNVFYTMDKVRTCKQLGIEEIVDDNYTTLARLSEHGIKPYGVIRPYNRQLIDSNPKITPVTGIQGVMAHILETP